MNKRLGSILPKRAGRSGGKVTVRHQGGRGKRFMRHVQFDRQSKIGIEAVVLAIEIDPNRNARIALVQYADGDKKYILAPLGLKVGQKIYAGEEVGLETANSMPLSKIAIGTQVHNIEIKPGKGAQAVKAAGSVATVQGREENYVLVKMPSGEVKRFSPDSYATVGQVGNIENKNKVVGKAGTKIKWGIRPTVRGVAQHPHSHPHGGGEGRSGVGLKYPKTPWGKPAVGKTRNRHKYSDKLIVSRRKKGKHN